NKKRSSRPSARRGATQAELELPFANYTVATKWLYEHVDLERTRASRVDPETFKLDRVRALLKQLGDPQDTLQTIHVAGTNGKGSIVAMLGASLRGCGLTVGTMTSPHLTDLRERIQINDSPITHPAMAKALSTVAEASLKLPKKLGSLTFFEIMTVVGFLHLAEQAVDVAVIEVGLGGRLDATNVITPVASLVASIGLDHMQYLGDTLEEIAREKAGIFKEGVPAITLKQDKEILDAMAEVAEKAGTTLQVVGKDIEFSYRFESSPQLGPHCRVGLSTERLNFEHVPVPLPGEHQAGNCGLVLSAIDALVNAGFELPEAKVFDGLASTSVPARMELIDHTPRLLLDGAHNPMAIEALIRAIGAHVAYDSMVMIFGCSADKDVEGMLEKVALGADKVIFTRAKSNPRAVEASELRKRFEAISPKMCQEANSLDEALSIAGRAGMRDDLIVITGSFYLAGEAKKLLSLRAERAGRALNS
ncbi:MAG: folylpolyglutamate synthase/dihydrofolate synthase family protein, partial [Planctomycetota bacterium]